MPAGDSWLLRLPRNESFQLQLREWDLAIPNLPEALDGLQIVQISDLHIAPASSDGFSRPSSTPATVGGPTWSS